MESSFLKNLLILTSALFISSFANAQTETNPNQKILVEQGNENQGNLNTNQVNLKGQYSAEQRLGIDYEIKNIKSPSVGLLESVELDKIESYRQENNTIEVLDQNTGNIIILYSMVDALKKESESKFYIDYIRNLYYKED